MARPKSKGAYVPLASQYFMDDAILEAGPEAELLFVRCLSFLASVPSDGFITERQVKTIVGIGLRNVPRRVESLLGVGLLEARPGGFVARSWTKWNRSAEEINKELAKDRLRKAQKHGEMDGNSARIPDGINSENVLQSSTEQSSTEQSNSTSSSDASGADGGEVFSADVRRLCELLGELVRANGHPVGVIGKQWWQACERLLRLDGYTPEQIEWMIRWATADEFWSANIRSMSKLREKFSTLKARAVSASKPAVVRRPSNAEQNLLDFQAKHGGDSDGQAGNAQALGAGVGR
jgi:hypothetical protein